MILHILISSFHYKSVVCRPWIVYHMPCCLSSIAPEPYLRHEGCEPIKCPYFKLKPTSNELYWMTVQQILVCEKPPPGLAPRECLSSCNLKLNFLYNFHGGLCNTLYLIPPLGSTHCSPSHYLLPTENNMLPMTSTWGSPLYTSLVTTTNGHQATTWPQLKIIKLVLCMM